MLLKSTADKSAAQKFINFCISEKGKEILKEKGYNTSSDRKNAKTMMNTTKTHFCNFICSHADKIFS